ncbi:hypothetical protein CDD82_1668 [Ophiocordyceps australis]|uniref:RNA-dependent RNA polymerase n=1 Tax=Ophiocordyceps australis TaxID=1399860 RepID=A0A2C5ZL50_9HYPO|nr:hypothetical protein CDD82_1668 [Ophiocordyceps australis]
MSRKRPQRGSSLAARAITSRDNTNPAPTHSSLTLPTSQRNAHEVPTLSKAQNFAPQGWRNWIDLSVRIGGLPPDVTTKNIWHWFSREGCIVWIEINDAKNPASESKSARVRFEPPPHHSFWERGTVRVSLPESLSGPKKVSLSIALITNHSTRWRVNSSLQREYPIRMETFLASLQFGSMVGPLAFMPKNSLYPMPHLEEEANIKLEVDVKAKTLTVFFPVASSSQRWPGIRHFCFRVSISHISKLYQTSCQDGSVAWILPLSRPPSYFWKMEDVSWTLKANPEAWSAHDQWYRATGISKDLDAPLKYPLALHNDVKDPAYIEVGRWTSFRFIFPGHPEKRDADAQLLICEALRDFNVVIEHCHDLEIRETTESMWDHINRARVKEQDQASLLLQMSADKVISLDFCVRYQLEVCISRGIFNECTITRDFLVKLAQLDPLDARRRLEYLVDQHEMLYDPMDTFTNSDAQSYMPNLKCPHYCTLMRKAIITPTTIRYSSPVVETSNRVVRRYNQLGDRFLRVQFLEESESGRICLNNNRNEEIWRRMLRTLFHGIRIGDRVYEFLGFGSSQLRQCGAYFFCPDEHVSCDDMRQWMGEFSHIKVVAKYAARLGQCFSTTRQIRSIFQPKTQRIPDIERNGYCFTDGVGMISQFVARLIIEEVSLDVLEEPTAFQFRMGGCKGVLAVWPQAKGLDVFVRQSQEKFKAETNGLEIIRCAKYSTATLNRQTITILESLGVPISVFKGLLERQIREYQSAMTSNQVAIELLTKYVDENQSTLALAELLKAGFKSNDIQEPFVLNLLNLWRSWSLKLLKEKARILVEKSAFVLGCVDETGTLRGHMVGSEGSSSKDINQLPQIFLQLTNPSEYGRTTIIEGICVVGRNPSLHPGDIRVVHAVDNTNLHHLKDVVVFPSTGDRPIPSMLSGGDLDGDDFFVLWDEQLIPSEWNFAPMNYTGPEPVQINREVNVDDVRDFFVKYMKNDVLGLIATAHLGQADQHGPKSPNCLKLAELHSQAVDYPKTGEPAELPSKLMPKRWPHFMEKKNSYQSKKALGVLYDIVVKQAVDFLPDWHHSFDQRILARFQHTEETLETARGIKLQYDIAVRRVLAQHGVATEFELYTSWAMSKPAIGSDYKRQEELGREYMTLKERFQEVCRQAVDRSVATNLECLVAAMYKVAEQEMKTALEGHHTTGEEPLETKSMPLISFPWIFPSILVRLATGDTFKHKKCVMAETRRWAFPAQVAISGGEKMADGIMAPMVEHEDTLYEGEELVVTADNDEEYGTAFDELEAMGRLGSTAH